MAALCKAPTKSAGIGLSITAICKNTGTGRFFCSDNRVDTFFLIETWVFFFFSLGFLFLIFNKKLRK